MYSAHVYVNTPSGLCGSRPLQCDAEYAVKVLGCDNIGQMHRMDNFCLSALYAMRESKFALICGDKKKMVHRLPDICGDMKQMVRRLNAVQLVRSLKLNVRSTNTPVIKICCRVFCGELLYFRTVVVV